MKLDSILRADRGMSAMLSRIFTRRPAGSVMTPVVRKDQAKRPSFRPQLESLEERMLLATDTWTGAGGTPNWSNPANWDTGHAPQNGDDLNINTLQVLTNDLTPGMILHTIT